MFLYSEDEYQEVDLYLPGGAKVHYDRTSDGTGYTDAAFRAGPTTGPFRDSTITWIIDGWSLKTRDGLTYWFPDWSRGSSITDRNGNTVTLTRDGASGGGPGQDLTQITSPSGRWIKLAYDNAHRITEARDNIGRTVSYTYDAGGRLSTVTNPAGDMTQYAYDTAGRITSITDARGIAYLTNEYDTNGRVARQTLTDGQVFEFEYVLSSEGRVSEARVTQPDGSMRRVTFNIDGVATSDTTAAGSGVERTTSFTRRADNLVTAVTDPYGRVSELDYDEQGRLVSTTVLAGTEDEATLGTTVYGRFDLPVEQTDPEGNTTRMRYDNRGNLIETIDPEGRSRTATYTDTGQLASVSDAAGNTTEFSYVSGDLVAMTGPTGEKTRLFTDAAGRRTATRTPSGAGREVAYDVLNQPVRVTDPIGNVEQYEYDANGNVTSFTDSAGGVTHWTYDDSDRLIQRTDALGASESRTYDTAGRLASASSRAGRTTTYQYDAFSRLVTAEHSLGGSANSTVTYEYDVLDRPTQVVDSSAGTTTITYDARDQVAEVVEPAGTSTYDYDANGRVVSATAAGQPARQYSYDATGALAGVAQDGVSVDLAHDTAGRLSQVSLPGGWTQSYTYDANNLVSDLTYEHDGQVQGDLTYAYLPDGQPGSVTGSYARVTLPEARSGMEYDAQNRLVTSGGAGIDYDADGNMLDDGTRTYEWDELGRLTSITTGTTSTGFGYSPTGERSSRDDGADRTEFLDVGPNPAVELDANGQVNAELLSGGMDQWFSRCPDRPARIACRTGFGRRDPGRRVCVRSLRSNSGHRRRSRGRPRIHRSPGRRNRPELPSRSVLQPRTRTIYLRGSDRVRRRVKPLCLCGQCSHHLHRPYGKQPTPGRVHCWRWCRRRNLLPHSTIVRTQGPMGTSRGRSRARVCPGYARTSRRPNTAHWSNRCRRGPSCERHPDHLANKQRVRGSTWSARQPWRDGAEAGNAR
jgi:YD repeat-containing protein